MELSYIISSLEGLEASMIWCIVHSLEIEIRHVTPPPPNLPFFFLFCLGGGGGLRGS